MTKTNTTPIAASLFGWSPCAAVGDSLGKDRLMKYARINGHVTEAPEGAIAWKYTDPTEDARWIYDAEDYREIEVQDPSLIEDVATAPVA